MNMGFLVTLSTLLFSASVLAETKMIRVAICKHDNKNYSILSMPPEMQNTKRQDEISYAILESDPKTPEKMARTTVGVLKGNANNVTLPSYWRPQSIPMSSCNKLVKTFRVEEVIREFYVKTYFIPGDTMPTEDIEEVVKRGDAVALKVRILCKSDELTDDVTLCKEITLMDQRIPVDPPETRFTL